MYQFLTRVLLCLLYVSLGSCSGFSECKEKSLEKHRGQWEKIRLCHLQKLKEKKINDFQKAESYNVLATNSHYLGEYDAALKYSLLAGKYAVTINQKARSYYLTSAAYRSKAQQKGSSKQNKANALLFINKALDLVNDSQLTDKWRAKIFFNAGALNHDLFSDITTSQKYYNSALRFFPEGSDDYARASIRLIRSILESGDINIAKDKLKKLHRHILPQSKTHVHFLQLEAKLNMACNQYEKANVIINRALAIAKDQSLKGDIDRIEGLQVEISKKVS